jgi:hypothetical protein
VTLLVLSHLCAAAALRQATETCMLVTRVPAVEADLLTCMAGSSGGNQSTSQCSTVEHLQVLDSVNRGHINLQFTPAAVE